MRRLGGRRDTVYREGVVHAWGAALTHPSVQTASPYLSNAADPFGTPEQKTSPLISVTHCPGPHTGTLYRSSRMPPYGGEHLTSPARSLRHVPPGGGHCTLP